MPSLRQESAIDFVRDEAFQEQGGVQYYYELGHTVPHPQEGSAWARLLPLDERASPGDSFHVLMSRIEYTVQRDASFFTEARARDVEYLQKVAPEMGIRLEGDGSFRVSKMPSNRFTLSWVDDPNPTDAAGKRFLELVGGKPDSIVIQRNSDFDRVLGFRTAERSVTYTAHLPLAPGKTRVSVCTLSLLHHLPPPFIGGRDRIFRESVQAAASLIQRLRDYRGP
jgi:hypothetical protein